jgi:endonuclease III
MQNGADEAGPAKLAFDIDAVLERVWLAVRPFPQAALFELAEEGFRSPFEVLVACLISVRTHDEVTVVVARRLFARARTPEGIVRLPVEELTDLIAPTAFRETKAGQLATISRRVLAEHGGELPCEDERLRSFAGVGPKCANLVLGIACGQARVAVDVHVDRVTNRWGYVPTKTPEATMVALEQKLPRRYWLEINRLLVPFGKHICTGTRPLCSTCPVLEYCRQVGVTSHR